MISADAITSRTFTTVRFKEGYSAREVDDFLDEIVDRMATGDHSLARRIKEKTFSNVRFREGYDIDEVDDFLDEVARGLEGDAGASTAAMRALTWVMSSSLAHVAKLFSGAVSMRFASYSAMRLPSSSFWTSATRSASR